MASLVKTDKISTTAGGAQEFTLPAADGTANQHLKTDGSGVLGWASPPTGVALTGSTNTWIPTITGADALTGTANFTYDGNTLDVKNSGTASSINLYCETGNAHYTKIKSGPHSGATSYTITLPNAPPTVSGQALTATTAGVGSWSGNSPSWFAMLNNDQNISNSTLTRCSFNTVVYDTASGWEAGNYRYVVPAGQGGKYLVFGQLTMQNAGANVITQIKLIPFKNDAVYSVMDFTWAGITNTQTVSGTWVMDLAASDNCDLRGWMTTSSGTNYFNGFGSEYNCFFAGFKLIGI